MMDPAAMTPEEPLLASGGKNDHRDSASLQPDDVENTERSSPPSSLQDATELSYMPRHGLGNAPMSIEEGEGMVRTILPPRVRLWHWCMGPVSERCRLRVIALISISVV